MNGVVDAVLAETDSDISDTSDSDKWIDDDESNDADVEIVDISSSTAEHVSMNSDASSRTSSTVSLLNVMKAPKSSSLSRKQSQARNPIPPHGK